jgi:hypothetical protein
MNAVTTEQGSMIERAIHEAEELFVSAGQAKVRAEQLDYRRKSVRASMFIKHKATVKSAAEAAELAECDPVYELAKEDWFAAAMEAETLKARAEGKRMKFEAWRTANATKRAQMNLR